MCQMILLESDKDWFRDRYRWLFCLINQTWKTLNYAFIFEYLVFDDFCVNYIMFALVCK